MPKPSAENITTDADLANWIAQLEASGDDCRSRLSTVGQLLREKP